MILWVLLGILPGINVALQSPTNVALSKEIGRLEASLVSFAGGLIIIVPFLMLFGTGDVSLAFNAEPWKLLGGIYAGINIIAIIYAGPVIGIALSLTLNMLGQLFMGMIIDAFGWLGVSSIAISPLRAVGCLMVAGGVLLTYLGKKRQNSSSKSGETVVAVLFALISGFGSAVQAPTNRALAALTGGLEATFVSIVVSVLLFALMIIVSRLRRETDKTGEVKKKNIRPWMLTGGVYCFLNIFLNLTVIKYIGAALLASCFMFGQLGGSTIVDTFGLLQSEKIKMDHLRLAGLSCILLGIIAVTYAAMK